MTIALVLIGITALLGAAIAFLPLLGWLNSFVVPLAAVGLAVGLFARYKTGRNLDAVVVVLALRRLVLGGGLF